MREYFGSTAKGQVFLVLLQMMLLVPMLLGRLSLYYVAPVVVTLAITWSWLDYSKKTQRVILELLIQFENLLDDFGRLNFQHGGEADDRRIVKLLDIISSTTDGGAAEVSSIAVPKIKDLFFIFQFWYFSMRDKVKIMIRRAGVLLDHDLVELANDFVEFYNGYLDKIADGTLRIVNRQELLNSKRAREIFKFFTLNSSELRGRANVFLRKLRGYGYSISGMDVNALESDPWVESISADIDEKTATPVPSSPSR